MAFLNRALTWLPSLGVRVERVMTDNRPQGGRSVTAGACARERTRGSAYVSHAFRDACRTAGLKHKRTRPYTPRTNGKAERFIQTSLREWAYLQAFASSAERTAAMRPWLHAYNRWRPHSALSGKPPLSRLPGNNLHSNNS